MRPDELLTKMKEAYKETAEKMVGYKKAKRYKNISGSNQLNKTGNRHKTQQNGRISNCKAEKRNKKTNKEDKGNCLEQEC